MAGAPMAPWLWADGLMGWWFGKVHSHPSLHPTESIQLLSLTKNYYPTSYLALRLIRLAVIQQAWNEATGWTWSMWMMGIWKSLYLWRRWKLGCKWWVVATEKCGDFLKFGNEIHEYSDDIQVIFRCYSWNLAVKKYWMNVRQHTTFTTFTTIGRSESWTSHAPAPFVWPTCLDMFGHLTRI